MKFWAPENISCSDEEDHVFPSDGVDLVEDLRDVLEPQIVDDPNTGSSEAGEQGR